MKSLSAENKEAVQHAIMLTYRYLRAKYHQVDQDALMNLATDAAVLVIHKIQQGQYVDTGHKVSTYLISVGINLYRNFARKQKLQVEDIDDHQYRLPDHEQNIHRKLEIAETITYLFSQISSICKAILQLKYFQQLSDDEIISQGLVAFKSIGALKNKRSKCLQDLRQMIKSNRPN
jgi:DNA-directed RNA polymerase specialized sigma24 family protein